jgi:hypothetical protein
MGGEIEVTKLNDHSLSQTTGYDLRILTDKVFITRRTCHAAPPEIVPPMDAVLTLPLPPPQATSMALALKVAAHTKMVARSLFLIFMMCSPKTDRVRLMRVKRIVKKS